MKKLIVCAFAVSLFTSWNSHGIVIRHDVSDEKYLAKVDDFPPLATLMNIGAHGTLIAPQWVVTAGHTVFCSGAGSTVQVGGKLFEVEQRFVHSDYDEDNLNNDLALLKLKTPVTHVKPATLYPHKDEKNRNIWFVGNGATGTGETGHIKKSPQVIEALRKAQNKVEYVKNNKLFFIFDKGDKGLPLEGVSGNGDSGGPAYQIIDDELYLLGVSSQAELKDPGEYGVREVYTRISSYTDWIDKVISGDGSYLKKHTSNYHFAPDNLVKHLDKVCDYVAIKQPI